VADRAGRFGRGGDDKDEGYLGQDAEDKVIANVLYTAPQSGTEARSIPPCDWKGNQCRENHFLKDCSEFVKLEEMGRLKHLSVTKTCLNCFIIRNFIKYCKSARRCRVDGCGRKHNTMIHVTWQGRKSNTTAALLTAGMEETILMVKNMKLNSLHIAPAMLEPVNQPHKSVK
jgi:hypothetical protein